jgi:hypothetical protein
MEVKHASIAALSLLVAVFTSFGALVLMGELSPDMQYETALPYLIGFFFLVFALSVIFMEKRFFRRVVPTKEFSLKAPSNHE